MRRITAFLLVATLFALFLPGPGSGPRAAAAATYSVNLPVIVDSLTVGVELFAAGIANVTEIAHVGDDRLFAAIRDGRIYQIEANGSVNPTPFLDIRDRVETGFWEQGLLGLAFHPDFETNGYFYIYYAEATATDDSPAVLARFTAPAAGGPVDPAGELRLLQIPHAADEHYGGSLHFGPDGYLYVSVGDAFQHQQAQEEGSLLGKVLRLDVDGGSPYAIPPDNPFAGSDTKRGEIWLMGLRNPWRMSFDRLTGDLYVTDVGLSTFEEVNIAPARQGGLNFGWPCYEGTLPGTLPTIGCGPASGYAKPAHQYDHLGGRCAVIGGYVYRGTQLPWVAGKYLFADLCSGVIWGLWQANGAFVTVPLPANMLRSWTTFGEDAAGELYLAELNGDNAIYRIVAP